jgi:hypothetical protein
MRRFVFMTTAAVILACSASAYAAINRYSASYTFKSHQAGTTKSPRPIGFTEEIKSSSATPGDRAGVLLDTINVIDGVKLDGKDFPTCTIAKIDAAQNDTGCPRRARLATGYINADIGSTMDFAKAGEACDPAIDMWNAGPGKIVVFLVATPQHVCLGGQLHTGGVPPYPASYTTRGNNLVINNPVPETANFPVGKTGGLVSSFQLEHLVWTPQMTTVKGKHVYSITSVGCRAGKRPYQTKFSATLPSAGPAIQHTTLRGSAPC